jgi:dihydroorotase
MSKFLGMGMPLEEVVARATSEPGRIIGKVPGLGTLAVGAPADLAIFDLVDGPVDFVDTRNNRRAGTRKLVPVLTVRAGPMGGLPCLSPSSIRGYWAIRGHWALCYPSLA